jgi:hypothetical protein
MKMDNVLFPLFKKADAEYIFWGSGFFITERALAPACHVVRGGGYFLRLGEEWFELTVGFEGYEPTPGPTTDDLAILLLPQTAPDQQFLSLATTIPSRESPLLLMGFLPNDVSPTQPKLHQATCTLWYEGSKNLDKDENKYFLHSWGDDLYEGDINGMSGGPILDDAGQVIALLRGGKYKPLGRFPPADPKHNFLLEAITSIHISDASAQSKHNQLK